MQNINKKTFLFLNELKLNNNRDWFEKNKPQPQYGGKDKIILS